MKSLALLALLASPAQTYSAQVVKVVDGDTLSVSVPAWVNTPFQKISIRIAGIDTPESQKQHAKCAKELKQGLAASAFAHTLAKPGDQISFRYLGHDKYFRIDANVGVSAGDWGQTMISNGYAAPYFGGKKQDWCK